MTREELAHLLRAAAKITDDPGILVIGSQSILGTYSEQDLPEQAWMSIEADIAFLDDPDAHKADLVDGAIGELSPFHEMYAYYAQGVEVTTASSPTGGATAWCRSFRRQPNQRRPSASSRTISWSPSSWQCARRTGCLPSRYWMPVS